MGAELLARALRDNRGAILGWGLGLAVLGLMLGYAYESVASNPAIEDYWESFPEEMRVLFGGAESLTSLSGYLQTEFFALLPVLAGIVAISRGARALVGEEEAGTMDLLMAQPVPRWTLVAWEALAVWLSTLLVCVVGTLGVAVGLVVVGVEVDLVALVGWGVLASLPAGLFGLTTLAAGAIAHRKRTAILVGSLVTAGAYFLDALAPLNRSLELLEPLSPMYHYGLSKPLAAGFDPIGVVVLVASAVPLLAVALVAFRQKDLGV